MEQLPRVAAGAKRVELTDDAGLPRLSIFRADGARTVLDAATLAPAPPDAPALERAATPLVPDGSPIQTERLTAPDAYWYAVGEWPRLPVLRLRFDDPARTWLHIDPETGEILERLDARGRAYRWLFDLLHKWDLNVLTLHRPLWDALLWLLSAVGLVTSMSGVWIGWRRLMRHA
jgi:hypothetical protein